MTYLIHSHHCRPVRLTDDGYTSDGVTVIRQTLGEPIRTFDTLEEAQAWLDEQRGENGHG